MNETDIDIEQKPVGNSFAQLIDRVLEPRLLGPAIGAIAVALGLFVIHEISGKIHLHQIGAAIAATPPEAVLSSLFLTIVSFCALALYDVLAVRRVAPDRVPAKIAIMAGMVGYGFSNAIGFHVFVGGPVRYRIYQAAGLDASDVGRIVGISLITFSGGLLAVLGIALILDPAGVPALQMLSPSADRALGAAIVATLAAALFWLSRSVRNVSLLGWRFPLPTAGNAVAQILIGALDIAAAAGALYVLLPADVTPSFVMFLLVFVVAMLATIISHAPGGLGVMEATILLGLGAGTRPDVVAALVVYRIIYYLLPLAVAAASLLVFEVYRARAAFSTIAGRTFRLTRLIVPPIATTLVLGGGMVMLFSANTPSIGDRTEFLSGFLPLPFAEASHLFASITGVLLIVIARGLFRRLALARIAAIALLLCGAAFSLLKGLDWEESLILCAVAAILYIYRSAFYRKGDWRSFRPDITWMALIAIVVGAFTLVGFLAYRHVEYQSDMWWDFAWDADTPRFLRSTVAIAIVAAAIALDALLHRPTPPAKTPKQPIPDVIRTILESAAGTNGCVALLGDKSFMISTSEKAFLMYAVSGRSWITMGDPVGEPGPSRGLLWRFVEAADRAGARPVFYSVQPDYLTTFLDMNLAILKIGENARVPLADFSLAGASRQALRYAEGRSAREGLVYSVIPKTEVPAVLPELRAVSDEWLEHKHGKEKGFSLGYFDDTYMSEFDCAVLRKEKEIVAFANLWRSGDHDEFSVDLMRYKTGVSKVLMEAFFAHLLLYGRDEGYNWFNLGAAPLAGLSDHPLASTWNRIGTFIYKRGDEFYNFDGLRAFKQKFDPVWTPQYMACPRGLAMPQVLLSVTTLISGGPMGLFKR